MEDKVPSSFIAYLGSKQLGRNLLGAASTSTFLSYHIARANVEIIPSITESIVNSKVGLNLAMSMIIAFMGLVALSAGHRGGKAAQLVAKWGDGVATFYASSAGVTIGWALGMSSAALVTDSGRYLYLALALMVYTPLLLGSPLMFFWQARRVVELSNDRMFPRNNGWRTKTSHALGLLLLVFSAVYWSIPAFPGG